MTERGELKALLRELGATHFYGMEPLTQPRSKVAGWWFQGGRDAFVPIVPPAEGEGIGTGEPPDAGTYVPGSVLPETHDLVVVTNPTTGYLEVLGRGRMVTVVELVDLSGQTRFTTDRLTITDADQWGAHADALSFARGTRSQRALRVAVPVPRSKRQTFVPSSTGHPIHPQARNLVRILSGYRRNDGTDEVALMATLTIDEVRARDASGSIMLDLECWDRLRPLDSGFDSDHTIAAGTNAVDAVLAIIAEVYSDTAVVLSESSEFVLPLVETESGGNRRQLVDKILEAIGFEITSDEAGRIIVAPVALTSVDPRSPTKWTYGNDGLSVGDVELRWSSIAATPAAVKVEGGSLSDDTEPPTVTVYDSDPSSQTYYAPGEQFGRQATTLELRNELVLTEQQCVVAGYAKLRQVGAGGGEVTFTAVPNPVLRAGDTLEFSHGNLGVGPSLWRIWDVSMPSTPTGDMSVTIRGSWEPQQ